MESLFNLSSHLASCSFKSHLEGISISIQSLSDVPEIEAPLGNQQNTASREALCFMGHFYSYISERGSEFLIIKTKTVEKLPGTPTLIEMDIMNL